MKKLKLFGGMRIKTLSDKEILSRDNAIQKAQNEALDIIEMINNADSFSNAVLLNGIKERAEIIDKDLDLVISKYL